ncbi:hypothetical protein AAES_13354 [Amazona aestiva]|uniref:Uncharacterized protein n=1 Tax=Amazona aestiva TaxID=12930 RepID=A0A0Q3U5W6_AMAAE|nr:hypothetical protein AAES_13354 [Amazona aestiva]
MESKRNKIKHGDWAKGYGTEMCHTHTLRYHEIQINSLTQSNEEENSISRPKFELDAILGHRSKQPDTYSWISDLDLYLSLDGSTGVAWDIPPGTAGVTPTQCLEELGVTIVSDTFLSRKPVSANAALKGYDTEFPPASFSFHSADLMPKQWAVLVSDSAELFPFF